MWSDDYVILLVSLLKYFRLTVTAPVEEVSEPSDLFLWQLQTQTRAWGSCRSEPHSVQEEGGAALLSEPLPLRQGFLGRLLWTALFGSLHRVFIWALTGPFQKVADWLRRLRVNVLLPLPTDLQGCPGSEAANSLCAPPHSLRCPSYATHSAACSPQNNLEFHDSIEPGELCSVAVLFGKLQSRYDI